MSTLPLFGGSSPIFDSAPPKLLRQYQSKAIQLLRNLVRNGILRILLVAPTGAGKMTIIAAIIKTASVEVLFVCDAMELIDQCVDALRQVGITNVGVMRGDDERVNPSATVQVCSIQTLARRDKPPAGLVLIDEAHLSASDSYQKHVFDHYKSAIIIGFTATPARLDGRPLGNLYQSLEVVCTYQGLIKDGFIAEPLCYGGPMEPDLSSVQTVGGDYDGEQLGTVMRDTSLIGQLLEHWKKLANQYTRPSGHPGLVEGPYRRTFVFAVNIQHSIDICDRFSNAGVRIAHLDGQTPETERKRIIKAIGSGELDAVTSVGVLLKGVDVPSVKCVVHARPTQSLVLWRQSTGRPLRPWHPGCRHGCTEHPSIRPIILDHAGNIPRHGFPHEDLHWELTSRARQFEKKLLTRLCGGCYAYLPAHKRICPYCNTEAPPPKERELPEESEIQLQALAGTPEEMRRMYLNLMVSLARAKGYKPGFASARYKQRYGAWPPWEWSQAIKASFASDPEWQASHAAHEKLKKKIEAQKAAKALAKIEEPEK
jgi:DNA repair protein RadD